MPTYEYLCKTCSHRFETWQKMTDEPLTICPECGGHIRRVLYPAGLVFKGHGFYKTDHGNGVSPASPAASDDSHDGKAAESKPGENGTGTKASENNTSTSTSTKTSESGTSAASVK